MDINAAVWEQGMMIDAAIRSSAQEITAISPHMGYMRQDRQARGREAVGTSMIMRFLSGANRFVAVDLHSSQSTAILQKPFDTLTSQRALENAMKDDLTGYEHDECIVVAPDAGASKLAQRHMRRLDLGMMTLTKQRGKGDSSKIRRTEKVPEVDGRVCLVFDDMIDTAGTLVTAAEALKHSGAKAVMVAATHGVFSDPALDRLKNPAIDKIYVTDTFPMRNAKDELGDKLHVVSVAPIIGNAIIEIVTHGSVSRLFEDENHM
jgi:ribose-phosphate pyrophosphokinase